MLVQGVDKHRFFKDVALNKAFEISVAHDKSYIQLLVLTPLMTMPIAMEATEGLKEVNDKVEINRFLLDLRNTRSTTTVNEKYEFAYEKLKALVQIPSEIRGALLKAEGNDSFRFLETVMRNANYNFRVFDNEDDAIGWLTR